MGAPAVARQASDLLPHRLRVEYLERPLAIIEPRPRLSWALESEQRNQRQSGYQILVASSPELLRSDRGDLWDSGHIKGDGTAHIEYAGRPLRAGDACHWKVRAWDSLGQPGPWSEAALWEVGLSQADWKAEWIDTTPVPAAIEIRRATYQTLDAKIERDVTAIVAEAMKSKLDGKGPGDFKVTNEALGGDPAYGIAKELVIDYTLNGALLQARISENAELVVPNSSLPALHKAFVVETSIRRARLHATALGVYELSLNGTRVGNEHLAPGWTDYRRRVRTQTYDVTDSLRAGGNVLGAIVAPGWFCGHAGLFNAHRFYGEHPALLLQLEIDLVDGTKQRIISDGSWLQAPTGTLQADLLKGETHDARASARIQGWDLPGFDTSTWSPVKTRSETRTLEPDISEPARIVAQLPATALSEPAPGKWTFDLGQNMVGVARLRLTNTAPGTVITLRYAEILNPDGTIYTQNLRGATSIDTYISRGSTDREPEEWTPRFTFHGFRYVEVTGLVDRPSLDAITGIVIASDMPVAGTFECFDPALNQLHSNIQWGLRGNYLSIPTDCPQRDERMGWMADAQVFLPTAACNADVAAFMSKWMVDVIDAQREDGAHSDVAPVMKGLSYGTPAWADAGTIVPWVVYERYGDKRILERSIDSMIQWVDWCRDHSTGLIRDRDRGNDYGDWLSIHADTPKDLLGTAYFAHSVEIVARSLRVLGRDSDAARYEQLFADIKAAFIAKFVGPDGRIHGESQTGAILALRFGLLPESLRANVAQRLVSDIRAKDNHLSTGFVGVSHLLPVLDEAGYSDIALQLLHQDTFPSWLFSVKHGATTIWERWDGWTPASGPHRDWTMNSFNHYSLGSCGRWMFERLAGIACDPATPGFARAVIRPCIDPALTFAKATRRTMRGDYACAWRIDGDAGARILQVDVTIPANASASIHIPVRDVDTPPIDASSTVRESGRPLNTISDLQSRVIESSDRFGSREVVVEVGSGTYRFTSPWH